MTEGEDIKHPPSSGWLELANGGGVLFRDPSTPEVLPPKYTPLRRTKQLPERVSRSDS